MGGKTLKTKDLRQVFDFGWKYCAVGGKKKKRKAVALSNIDAEYMGVAEGCREDTYLINFLYVKICV